MKDLHTTLGFALGLSVPATVLCWFYTLALVPSGAARQGIVGILLAPEFWLVGVLKQNGIAPLSGFAFVPLALLVQFIGYAIVIHVIRLASRLLGTGERPDT